MKRLEELWLETNSTKLKLPQKTAKSVIQKPAIKSDQILISNLDAVD